MTGMDAAAYVIDEQKCYIKHHHKRPKAVTLSWELAMDLLKLTKDQIGDLASRMWVKGEAALAEEGIFGLKVTIDYETDGHRATFRESSGE